MSRKAFDLLTSAGGAVVVVVLVVAGGLLVWGHSFVNSNVHNQLAQQQISFPPTAAFAHPNGTEITKSMTPKVSQYAGEQLLTGAQAKVYADDFISVHLSEMPDHGIYSTLSAAVLADPTNAKLAAVKDASFTGTTLRGLLLEAYAFSKIGALMMLGAIAAFILAALMAMLVGLGIWHAGRTAEETQLLRAKAPNATPVPVT
jgi:hypothetical protein